MAIAGSTVRARSSIGLTYQKKTMQRIYSALKSKVAGRIKDLDAP
jgi:hypothetical protein